MFSSKFYIVNSADIRKERSVSFVFFARACLYNDHPIRTYKKFLLSHWWYCIQAYNIAYPLYLFPKRNMLDFQSRGETSTADRARCISDSDTFENQNENNHGGQRLDKHERRRSVSLSGNNDYGEECQRKGPSWFFPSMPTSGGLPRPRLCLLWSRVVFLEASPSPPLRRPIFRILYEPRRSIIFLPLSPSFSLFLVRLLRNSLSAKGEGWREEEGRGWEKAVENVGRVPARHCHFHRLAAFPRLFLLLSPAVPCRRLPPIAARKAGGNENTSLFIRRKAHAGRSSGCFGCSICRWTGLHEMIADPTELSHADPLLKINM